MFGSYFYNQTIKRYIEVFGWIFKDVMVERQVNDAGEVIQQQYVPISFEDGEKYLQRTEEDPKLERAIAQQLPKIVYNLEDIHKDTSRQLQPINKLVCFNTDGSVNAHYVPVPYNFVFTLNVRGRNNEDMYKMAEQIFPYFAPNFTVRAVIVDGMSPQNLTFNLDAVNFKDTFQGPFIENRGLEWVFTFTLNGWFYGPDLDSSTQKVIRWVNTSEAADSSITSPLVLSSNTYPTVEGKTIDEILPSDNYILKTDSLLDVK